MSGVRIPDGSPNKSLAFTPLSSVFARLSSFSKRQVLTGFDDVKSVSICGVLNPGIVKGHWNIYASGQRYLFYTAPDETKKPRHPFGKPGPLTVSSFSRSFFSTAATSWRVMKLWGRKLPVSLSPTLFDKLSCVPGPVGCRFLGQRREAGKKTRRHATCPRGIGKNAPPTGVPQRFVL